MEIYINGENIPFELENEKNAWDVVAGINEFASNSTPQLFITSIFIDGKEYSYADDEGLAAIAIDDIGQLAVDTADLKGITLISIEQIEKYLTFVASVLAKSKWESSFTKVHQSIEWMKDGVEQIIGIYANQHRSLSLIKANFASKYEELYGFFSTLSEDMFPLAEGKREAMVVVVAEIQSVLKQLKKIVSQTYIKPENDVIHNNICEVTAMIDDIIPSLEKIPVLFQTGEDQKAMELIRALASVIEKSIGLFIVFKETLDLYLDDYVESAGSFEDFFNTITELLKELMSAIENNDTVMMGDLVEYEFIPNLEEIKKILLKVKEEALSSVN